MKFILVIVAMQTSSAAQSVSATFYDRPSCEAARAEMEAGMNSMDVKHFAICSEQGEPGECVNRRRRR